MDRTKLVTMYRRYEAEGLSYHGTYRTVALLGMQMCGAVLEGGLVRFTPGNEPGRVAGDWPNPFKFAPPDIA